MTISLTPEMVEIIDKLRGDMSPKSFLLLLLRIADSPGSVAPTPEEAAAKEWKAYFKVTSMRRSKSHRAPAAKAPPPAKPAAVSQPRSARKR